MFRILTGLILLVGLSVIVVSSLGTVGNVVQYNMDGASAVQIQQVYGKLTFELAQSIVALLAILVLLEIGNYTAAKTSEND